MDFSRPRVIVELGPGEGCHTRHIAKKMCRNSHLILFELDKDFCRHLQKQFRDDPRITILNRDAMCMAEELERLGHGSCDYVVSGIPFLVIESHTKTRMLENIRKCMAPGASFITYQVSLELKEHASQLHLNYREYCLLNFPPINILEFLKPTESPSTGKSSIQRTSLLN
jgi:phospholipid N-methyltransferase